MWGTVHYEVALTWASWPSLVLSLCSYESGSPGVVETFHELLHTRVVFYQSNERMILLLYALTKDLPINVGVVLKSSICKSRSSR